MLVAQLPRRWLGFSCIAETVVLVACGSGTVGSEPSSGGGGMPSRGGTGGRLTVDPDGHGATGTRGASAAGAGGTEAASTSTAASTVASSAGATTSAAASSSASGGGDPVDACLGKPTSCPASPPKVAGQGLVAIDRCAFPLADHDSWDANASLIAELATKLPSKDVAGILTDLNRTAVTIKAAELPGSVPGFVGGFRWNDGDNDVAYWIPQGLTGSADANATGLVAGRHVAVVSWYYEKALEPGSTYEKGVRLAFVDTTASPPKYRLALLVEPTAGNLSSFKAVEVHAGGIAWFGDKLYVADTTKGFRVFDLAHILALDPAKDMIGYDPVTKTYGGAKYAYVVPQVGRYVHASACGLRFSFVGLDRSQEPPSLVSGEYCNGTDACDEAFSGRVFRWPVDKATGRLGAATSFPSEAYYMGERQVQGALMRAGTTLLSSSAPAAGAGELYVIPPQKPRTKLGWVDMPEDLYQNLGTKQLWGLSERAGARHVFAVTAP
ncbi:MAG: hypothetical protein FJ096_18435 [Deltaproteobacteria bacterium]|nr:hypothetical protein [Deltaproteobacteria bacterium]